MNATAHITNLNIGKLTQVSSTIGHIPLTTEKIFLNKYINRMLPLLNAELEAYVIEFPSNIFGIFELSDLFMNYHDGYVFVGATPTFVPIGDPYEEVFSATKAKKAEFMAMVQHEAEDFLQWSNLDEKKHLRLHLPSLLKKFKIYTLY